MKYFFTSIYILAIDYCLWCVGYGVTTAEEITDNETFAVIVMTLLVIFLNSIFLVIKLIEGGSTTSTKSKWMEIPQVKYPDTPMWTIKETMPKKAKPKEKNESKD